MDTNALVRIDNAVYSFLNEKNEGNNNFLRYKQIVIECLTQELNVRSGDGIKVYPAYVDEVNNIDLPADCIKILRIGIVQNGQLHQLVKNDNLVLGTSEACGVEVANEDLLRGIYIPGGLNYARGGGVDVGEYRIDVRKRVIKFRGHLTGTLIVIEYRSSGVSIDSETYIPVTTIPVLKEYLEWTLLKRDMEAPVSRVVMAQRNYINAKRRFVYNKNSFSLRDLLDVINKGRSQGVK